MNRFSTECSRKLCCVLYGSKKEFDNFAMLYINRKVAILFTIRYEGKCVCLSRAYRGLTGGVRFAPEFQCCYFCESSCLFYLSFNFDFYFSKIMHL